MGTQLLHYWCCRWALGWFPVWAAPSISSTGLFGGHIRAVLVRVYLRVALLAHRVFKFPLCCHINHHGSAHTSITEGIRTGTEAETMWNTAYPPA